MQIQVTQREIEAGLITYLKSRGFTDLEIDKVSVTFTQGRKGSGLTATLTENPVPPVGSVAVAGVAVTGVTTLEQKLPAEEPVAPDDEPMEPEVLQEPQDTQAPANTGASLFGADGQ